MDGKTKDKKYSKCNNMLVTKNNPEGDAQEWLRGLYEETHATYVCGQLEEAPTTGTKHIQAYVNYKTQARFSKIHKYDREVAIKEVRINNGAHTYCMKEDTRLEGPWEFGDKPMQRNNKTDWKEVKLKAKTNRLDDVPDDIYIKYYATLKKIAKDNIEYCNKDDLRGIWIYGPSGCGKTRAVQTFSMNPYPKARNEWWDGYQGEGVVVMDDVDKYDVKLGGLLKDWADRYGKTIQTKGSAITDNWKYFIVTSQYAIEEIWSDEQTRDALNRRFMKMRFLATGEIELRDRSPEVTSQFKTLDIKDAIESLEQARRYVNNSKGMINDI